MPLILFLHGAGERGNDFEKLKKSGPFETIARLRLPFIIAAPQCPSNRWWGVKDMADVEGVLDAVTNAYAVDPARLYLTGLSMGGQGTWELLMDRPHMFAAAAPICGPHTNTNGVEAIRHIPIWAFHGAKDPVVPLAETEKMVAALKALGADITYTVYPEAKHDSWTQTYANPKLYEWFLSHTRK